jgi:hypothetical protein
MPDELIHDIEAYLKNDREDRAGLDFLQSLGEDGVQRLIRQVEADYAQAAGSIELSGRDVARLTVLAHSIARAAGVTSKDGKETMAKLVEVGWLMARWYERE